MGRLLILMLVFLPGIALAQPTLTPDAKVAFLGITFLDTSTEGAYNGVREDEQDRVGLMEKLVAERFREEGMDLVDLAPVAETLEATTNPADCYGCEIRMAEDLGADYVLVGEIQKVSNLILSMNLVLRDVASGEMVRGLSVDIRSNTDESWSRGMRYILKNNIFRKDAT